MVTEHRHEITTGKVLPQRHLFDWRDDKEPRYSEDTAIDSAISPTRFSRSVP
jgi:hypothetical protein